MLKVLITGISGQDGSYLAELALSKGYEVHGIVRRHSVASNQDSRLFHIANQINTHYGDLLDPSSLEDILKKVQPDRIFNLAAQSHVWVSSAMPSFTTQVNALGVVNLLHAAKNIVPKAKFYQASSSEIFGNTVDIDGYQREGTNKNPVSPYGCAKLFGYHIARHYREAYGMFVSNGILFNHESSRRGENFVTQKIVKAAINIKAGKQQKLLLGNIKSHRDWSHAKDMVRGMWMMLDHHEPDDFVLSSCETHSVEEFCKIVFQKVGIDYDKHVEIDSKLFRPQELFYLKGDCSKAKSVLGWEPEFDFEDLIEEMIDGNLYLLRK